MIIFKQWKGITENLKHNIGENMIGSNIKNKKYIIEQNKYREFLSTKAHLESRAIDLASGILTAENILNGSRILKVEHSVEFSELSVSVTSIVTWHGLANAKAGIPFHGYVRKPTKVISYTIVYPTSNLFKTSGEKEKYTITQEVIA